MNQRPLLYEHINLELFLLSQRPFILKQTWISFTLASLLYETKPINYKPEDNQNWPCVRKWWGEKSKEIVLHKEGVTAEACSPALRLQPGLTKLLSLGNDDRYRYPGAPSAAVSPGRGLSHARWHSNPTQAWFEISTQVPLNWWEHRGLGSSIHISIHALSTLSS